MEYPVEDLRGGDGERAVLERQAEARTLQRERQAEDLAVLPGKETNWDYKGVLQLGTSAYMCAGG